MSQFLAAYERYAMSVTDAPYDFLHAAGLACLSTISLGRRWIDRGSSGIQPNLYLMLLAGSSRDRKSTAVDMATDLIREVEPSRVGPSDFSSEGLVWSLVPRGDVKPKTKIVLPFPEFGDFLATAAKHHGSSLSPTLCQLYDGKSFERTRSGKPSLKIRNPRVALFGAVAFGMMERYADPTDWVTGFFARILWISPTERRPRFTTIPPANPRGLAEVRGALKELRFALKAARAPMALRDDAIKLYEEFSASIPEDLPDPAQAAQRERLLFSILKLAMLYQIDANHNAAIDVDAMTRACRFGQRAWDSFQIAYADSSGTPLARLAKRIWKRLSEAGVGKTVPQRELYRQVHATVDEFMPALEMLIKMQVVKMGEREAGSRTWKALEPYPKT